MQYAIFFFQALWRIKKKNKEYKDEEEGSGGKQGNVLFLLPGIQGHRVTEHAEQEPGQKPHFTDFQLNPFPLGYTALNELLDKGISKIWKNSKEGDSWMEKLKFPKGQSLSH